MSIDRFKWWLPLLNNITQESINFSSNTLPENVEEMKENQNRTKKIVTKKRQPNHYILSTINLILASSFMGATCELAVENKFFHHDVSWKILNSNDFILREFKFNLKETPLFSVLFDFSCLAFAIMWQCILEYYWHRLMHTPFCMRNFHKLVSFLL